MRPAALLLTGLLLAVAACSATPATPSPAGTPAPTPATPTASPSTAPLESGSPLPSADPATPSPAPTATPAPAAMTPDEASLLGALRPDAAVDCTPRRSDLPEGVLYAIECRPGDGIAARVGLYRLPSINEAAWTYMTRMAEAGVDVNAGDCVRDIPGDAPWSPGDGEGSYTDPGVFNWENSVLSPSRSGCFLDENGTANVRVTCADVYVGVLGAGTDLSDLSDWTWNYPKGYEAGTPDSPGICVGPDAIATAP